MKNLRYAIALLGLSAFGLLALSGCAGPTASDEDNVAAACSALGDLERTLTTAEADLAEANTVEDLRMVRKSVATAYSEADKAVDAVAANRSEALRESWQKLIDSATEIDSDTTLEDARDSLLEEARDVAQKREEAAADLECE